MEKTILLWIVASILSVRCDLVREFQQMDPPTIRSYYPNTEYAHPDSVSSIQLVFSSPMDPSSTEEAFVLKENDSTLNGTFRWDEGGTSLHFIPLSPVKPREKYSFSLSTLAEDRWGNSLPKEFSHTFFTKREQLPPYVVASSPSPGANLSSLREPIEIQFSERMDLTSILRSFSILPSMAGGFSWNASVDRLQWSPLEAYRPGETYRITIGKGAKDAEGNPMTEDYTFSFHIPSFQPAILSFTAVSAGKSLLPTVPGTYLDPSLFIEKDESFRARFSEPVPRETQEGIISIRPSAAHQIRWNDTGTEAILSFKETLEWDTVYEVQVKENIYRFRVNGPRSVPPTIQKIHYIPDTSVPNPVFHDLSFAHNYSFSTSPSAAFDLHIQVGTDATVSFSALLEAFSVRSSNGSVEIDFLRIERIPQSNVYRIHCRITAGSFPDVVTLTIGAELRDSWGNALPRPFTLVVNHL